MPTTAANRLPARKSKTPRFVRVIDKEAGLIRIIEGKKTDFYFVTKLDADFGRAFTCEKLERGKGIVKSYAVNVGDEGSAPSCECDGFLKWHQCRHIACLAALIEEKKL